MVDPPPRDPAEPPGLRERKKARTRQAISDVATRLFVERGFDAVTVADVAEAADVSVKTVFNHFGSKEELFLDREPAVHATIVAAVAERPPGRSVRASLEALLADAVVPGGEGWDMLLSHERYEAFRRFLIVWRDSRSLQGRHLMGNERLEDVLGDVLAPLLGVPPGEVRARTMAAMLVAVMQLRHRAFAEAVLDCVPAPEVERRVRALVAESMARVATAFPELDAARAPAVGAAAST